MLVATESQKARKFMRGLRADIYDRIAILKPNAYADAPKHAQMFEELVAA